MSITSEEQEIKHSDGSTDHVLVVSISKRALIQLESLKKFLATDDPVEVLKAGIAFLQGFKEFKESQIAKEFREAIGDVR